MPSWAGTNEGVTNGSLRGVWPPFLEIGLVSLFRPFSDFFDLFRRVWRAPGKSRKSRKKPFSSDLLKPPSLTPPICGTPIIHATEKRSKWPKIKQKRFKLQFFIFGPNRCDFRVQSIETCNCKLQPSENCLLSQNNKRWMYSCWWQRVLHASAQNSEN